MKEINAAYDEIMNRRRRQEARQDRASPGRAVTAPLAAGTILSAGTVPLADTANSTVMVRKSRLICRLLSAILQTAVSGKLSTCLTGSKNGMHAGTFSPLSPMPVWGTGFKPWSMPGGQLPWSRTISSTGVSWNGCKSGRDYGALPVNTADPP